MYTPIGNLTDRQIEIISLIINDNKLSRRALAKKLNINESAVKKHLNALKEKGVIKRVGGTRGYWKIKDSEAT